MKKQLLMLFALLMGLNSLNANPVDLGKAKNIGQKFACVKINNELRIFNRKDEKNKRIAAIFRFFC